MKTLANFIAVSVLCLAIPDPAKSPTLASQPGNRSIVVVEDTDSVFKDVISNVRETHTGSIMFGAGVNADAGLVGSVIINVPLSDSSRSRTQQDDGV
jgi:hypothetical protein